MKNSLIHSSTWRSLWYVALFVGMMAMGRVVWAVEPLFIDSGQSLGSSNSYGVQLGDVDGDGDLDAFVANYHHEANRVWLNNGDGTFTDSTQSLGSSRSRDVQLGDVDGDGDLDTFVTNDGTNHVWLNNGDGTFTDSTQSLGSSTSVGVQLGDVDGDGDLDAFVANYDNQANRVWLNNGDGTFTDSTQSLGSSYSTDVQLGDVDGNGDLDAFVANYHHEANRVWLNNGSGTFTDSAQSLGSSMSVDVQLGDVDGDGDLDAFVANYGEANRVWLNNGDGTFIDSTQSLGSSASYSVQLGDVDGDGDLDAFVANLSQANRVWLNNGDGTFTDSTQSLGSSNSPDVQLGDVDGDGDLDAFVANYSSQANKVWLNQSPAIQGNTLTFVPSATHIEPQIDNTLSVDLVVDGDALYGLQLDCGVDSSVLTLTGGSLGNFFDPANRLEIPLTLDAPTGSFEGAISLHAPATAVTGIGSGPFASLNFIVADTTATVSVATCTALFSGLAGEELSGTVSAATIVVDNGIHGGTGSISGQLTIPGVTEYCGIVVTLTNSATGRTLTTTTDCSGNFTFEGLRDGDYTLVADFDNYVLGCTAVSVSGGAATVLDPIAMLAGDLNNDGSIGIADFTLMAASFGLSLGDTGYNDLADINGDNTVNIFDLTILGAHFGIDNTTCP